MTTLHPAQPNLAAMLLARRGALGHSLEAAGDAVGKSRQTIGLWESGAVCPTRGDMPALATYLGRPLEELLMLRELAQAARRGAKRRR